MSLGLGILLLVASIGCLKCRRWARAGINIYGVLYGMLSVVVALITVTYSMPFIMDVVVSSQPPGSPPLPLGVVQGAMIVMTELMLLIATCVVFTFTTIVNRKVAVDAFNGILTDTPLNSPVRGIPATVSS